mmetsp:Transcript_83773/g.240837  ORF Transcript_83773/g.240837 Transcript_83773/m.240837 type:complete len:258 (+) Transcript_83773:958-1731(+)
MTMIPGSGTALCLHKNCKDEGGRSAKVGPAPPAGLCSSLRSGAAHSQEYRTDTHNRSPGAVPGWPRYATGASPGVTCPSWAHAGGCSLCRRPTQGCCFRRLCRNLSSEGYRAAPRPVGCTRRRGWGSDCPSSVAAIVAAQAPAGEKTPGRAAPATPRFSCPSLPTVASASRRPPPRPPLPQRPPLHAPRRQHPEGRQRRRHHRRPHPQQQRRVCCGRRRGRAMRPRRQQGATGCGRATPGRPDRRTPHRHCRCPARR